MKKFTQAPLPFTGQKRQFLSHFCKILNDNIPGDGEGWTIVDTFGGSGLLSHTAKQLKPEATVIYNDFDGYSERLKHISDINRLRQLLEKELGDAPRQKRIEQPLKERLIQVIEEFNGYKDPHVICTWLLFSGQQVKNLKDLYSKSFYHCLRKSDYPLATGYLDGIEVIQESFHTLLPKYQDKENVLLLLDPPYLCTHQASYAQETYFDLIDFLRLIHLTKPPYIFFSSTKSEFIRFIEWMLESKTNNYRSFENTTRISIKASTSYSGKYEDNLVYKFKSVI